MVNHNKFVGGFHDSTSYLYTCNEIWCSLRVGRSCYLSCAPHFFLMFLRLWTLRNFYPKLICWEKLTSFFADETPHGLGTQRKTRKKMPFFHDDFGLRKKTAKTRHFYSRLCQWPSRSDVLSRSSPFCYFCSRSPGIDTIAFNSPVARVLPTAGSVWVTWW